MIRSLHLIKTNNMQILESIFTINTQLKYIKNIKNNLKKI